MEYIILGPAAMGIFTVLGCLKREEENLKNIKEISGSSAGAILALFLALEIPLYDVLERLLSIDIEKLTKYKLKSLLSSYGLIDINPIRKILVKIYGCDPTFSELKKKIYVSAYCLNRRRTEYFSIDTHPEMKVIDAICLSISIPILTSTKKYRDMIYIDGGTKEIIPATPFIHIPYHKIMCVRLKPQDIYIENISNFKEFMGALLSAVLNVRAHLNTETYGKNIEVDTGNHNLFLFNMSYEEKIRMYLHGLNH
tara:strand:- start:472 stop:1233 length:762 start_codon:yes stop_codon:yes gene_type:complete